MSEPFEVAVIGGGIAGVSAAFELASTHKVVLVEAEENLAHHSTGRSAALFFENYGAEAIRPLTLASRPFLSSPHPDLTDVPLMRPRGAMWIARPDQAGELDQIAEEGRRTGGDPVQLTPSEACRRVPVLIEQRLAGGLWEPDPMDLDVAALHQAYVRGLRARDGRILTSAPVSSVEERGIDWLVQAGPHELTATTIVDAAGAWGDEVAELAGVEPVGLTPMRRTAFMVAGDPAWSDWPMVVNVDHDFYFKPDGSQLLCSPADETPSPPCDARPEMTDVALAIERINEATTLEIRSVRSQWAGLRTFAPDRAMVIGPEPSAPGFFWLVGQGGTGIQTAPAAATLLAAQVRGEPLPAQLDQAGVDPHRLGPARLRACAP
ncbi:MAG: FAD-binding oxidoreductase [Acidimicrobiia bacterium]